MSDDRPIYIAMMSSQTRLGEATEPLPERNRMTSNYLHSIAHFFLAVLKTAATAIVGTLLLPIIAIGFLVVFADYAWFRLREVRYGHPEPKGLWEF
jgi:uncharacterized membrane protein